MLSYLSIGANDVAMSSQFYEAVLVPLGYRKDDFESSVRFSLPDADDRDNGPGTIWIQKPFDGHAATLGNGMMPAFRAGSDDMVVRLHAMGVARGGTDEGAPGIRPAFGEHFYVAYLRDPVGNKIAIFHVREVSQA